MASNIGVSRGADRRGGSSGRSVSRRQLDLSGEQFDNIIHRVQQVSQRWDNKLTFPITKLSERYLRGDINLNLECSLGSGDLGPGKRFSISITKYGQNVLDRSAGRKKQVRVGINNHEFPVLVESVHIVNDAQRVIDGVIPSLVWLVPLNESENIGIRNALYFSVISSQFVFRQRLPKNGELNGVLVKSSRFGTGKLPDDMIQARPQVMNDLSAENAKPLRDFEAAMIINRFLPSLTIWLGDSWVLAFTKECDDFVVQINDTLIGPL